MGLGFVDLLVSAIVVSIVLDPSKAVVPHVLAKAIDVVSVVLAIIVVIVVVIVVPMVHAIVVSTVLPSNAVGLAKSVVVIIPVVLVIGRKRELPASSGTLQCKAPTSTITGLAVSRAAAMYPGSTAPEP